MYDYWREEISKGNYEENLVFLQENKSLSVDIIATSELIHVTLLEGYTLENFVNEYRLQIRGYIKILKDFLPKGVIPAKQESGVATMENGHIDIVFRRFPKGDVSVVRVRGKNIFSSFDKIFSRGV